MRTTVVTPFVARKTYLMKHRPGRMEISQNIHNYYPLIILEMLHHFHPAMTGFRRLSGATAGFEVAIGVLRAVAAGKLK